MTATARRYIYRGDSIVRDAATVVFMVIIAVLGAAMMTLTSSPLVKGAAFLWLPAALQLIAGVWLGPIRGAIAGGIGAQAAGVLAYGGWAPADFIMNLVAGGIANSLLPGLLFRWFEIDPSFETKRPGSGRAILLVLVGMFLAIGIALIQLPAARILGLSLDGAWSYVLPIIAIIIVVAVGHRLAVPVGQYVLASLIVVVCCLISAAIGVWGAVVGGQSWQAAFLATGVGWFLGDTASSILGLYVLAEFTAPAQKRGIAPILSADK